MKHIFFKTNLFIPKTNGVYVYSKSMVDTGISEELVSTNWANNITQYNNGASSNHQLSMIYAYFGSVEIDNANGVVFHQNLPFGSKFEFLVYLVIVR